MDPEDADTPLEARPPLLEDLVALCSALNRENARYVVLGGMAVIQAGFVRATNDIDLLIDTSPENQERVRRALMVLPDGAVRDMAPDDLDRCRTKQTLRDKDKVDLAFLARLLESRGETVD
jgi:hypothetical protein